MSEVTEPPNTETQTTAEAETPKQEINTAKTVPYDRFKEVNDKAKELEARLSQIEAESKAAKEKELAEQAKWQELAEQRAAELEAERTARLKLEVVTRTGLPVDMADRLRGATAEELTADAEKLLQFMKPAESKGVPPANGRQITPKDISNMTPEEIRKNKADLLK